MGIPSDTFAAQMRHESAGFSEDVIWQRRNSSAGARGIAQFMTATGNAIAAQLGVSQSDFWASPSLQLQGGALLMRNNLARYAGDMIAALVAYNAGEGNADYLRPYLGNPQAELDQLQNVWKDKQPREYIRAILGMARGGTITEPIAGLGLRSGRRYAFGEAGPEAVVPLGRGGGGGDVQVVHVPIVIGGRTVEELWIEGYDVAVRRGRVAGAGAASMVRIS
jgi:hypothetical protein